MITSIKIMSKIVRTDIGCSQAKKMTGVQKHKLQKRGVTKHKSFLENINLCGFTTFF
jgi:hypothetical protein